MDQEVKGTDQEVRDRVLVALREIYYREWGPVRAKQIQYDGSLPYDLQTIGTALRLLCLEGEVVKTREGYRLPPY